MKQTCCFKRLFKFHEYGLYPLRNGDWSFPSLYILPLFQQVKYLRLKYWDSNRWTAQRLLCKWIHTDAKRNRLDWNYMQVSAATLTYLRSGTWEEDYSWPSSGIDLIQFSLSWRSFFRATPTVQVKLFFVVTSLRSKDDDSIDLDLVSHTKKTNAWLQYKTLIFSNVHSECALFYVTPTQKNT